LKAGQNASSPASWRICWITVAVLSTASTSPSAGSR
jgi:hypothetical protein